MDQIGWFFTLRNCLIVDELGPEVILVEHQAPLISSAKVVLLLNTGMIELYILNVVVNLHGSILKWRWRCQLVCNKLEF